MPTASADGSALAGNGNHRHIVALGLDRHLVEPLLVGMAGEGQPLPPGIVQDRAVHLGQTAPLPDAEGPQIGAGRQHPVPDLGCARAVGVKGLVLLKPSLLQRLDRNAAAKAVVEVEQLLEPQGKIRRHREIRRIIPAGDGLRENDPPFGQGTQLDAPMPGLHAGFQPAGLLLQKILSVQQLLDRFVDELDLLLHHLRNSRTLRLGDIVPDLLDGETDPPQGQDQLQLCKLKTAVIVVAVFPGHRRAEQADVIIIVQGALVHPGASGKFPRGIEIFVLLHEITS